MKWEEVKKCYYEQWIIIEARSAHSEGENKRLIFKVGLRDFYI